MNKMYKLINIIKPPYAGIIQIRFNGYDLQIIAIIVGNSIMVMNTQIYQLFKAANILLPRQKLLTTSIH